MEGIPTDQRLNQAKKCGQQNSCIQALNVIELYGVNTEMKTGKTFRKNLVKSPTRAAINDVIIFRVFERKNLFFGERDPLVRRLRHQVEDQH